eukprot:6191501-Pleurochrysis_carterae.AAC.2
MSESDVSAAPPCTHSQIAPMQSVQNSSRPPSSTPQIGLELRSSSCSSGAPTTRDLTRSTPRCAEMPFSASLSVSSGIAFRPMAHASAPTESAMSEPVRSSASSSVFSDSSCEITVTCESERERDARACRPQCVRADRSACVRLSHVRACACRTCVRVCDRA